MARSKMEADVFTFAHMEGPVAVLFAYKGRLGVGGFLDDM